jgi:hypothetical protein
MLKGMGGFGTMVQGPLTLSATSRTTFGSGFQIRLVLLSVEKICSFGSSVRIAEPVNVCPRGLSPGRSLARLSRRRIAEMEKLLHNRPGGRKIIQALYFQTQC